MFDLLGHLELLLLHLRDHVLPLLLQVEDHGLEPQLDVLELLGLGLGLLPPPLRGADLGVQLVQHTLLASEKLRNEELSVTTCLHIPDTALCINVVVLNKESLSNYNNFLYFFLFLLLSINRKT